jgi:DNA-binding beta-propeller fold protein YncE
MRASGIAQSLVAAFSHVILLAVVGPRAIAGQSPRPCYATATSMTPPSHAPAANAPQRAPTPGLTLLREIPLPGPPNRFDYQSLDPAARRLYMNHMNAGQTLVFDVDSDRVVAEIGSVPRATGVLAVPDHGQVYISAAGNHEVAIVDDKTLKVVARVGDIRFPDGIAYATGADKVFISDEAGSADVVIDPATRAKRSTIALGGEAGNTHYDSASGCILVAVQTKNELVAIDPMSERVVHHYSLAGSDHPHGFAIDEPDRLAFVSCEGNATLIVVDLRTMKPIQRLAVGDDPDVLAWDPAWRRLYVASESGVLSVFWLDGGRLLPMGEIRAPHAHTVSVDPKTHRVYVPLESVGGHPVLRVYQPAE